MRALFIQFSGLVAALTFANQFFAGRTPADAVMLSLIAALTVYAVLVLGDVAVQRIIEFADPGPQVGPEAEASPTPSDPPGALAA